MVREMDFYGAPEYIFLYSLSIGFFFQIVMFFMITASLPEKLHSQFPFHSVISYSLEKVKKTEWDECTRNVGESASRE